MYGRKTIKSSPLVLTKSEILFDNIISSIEKSNNKISYLNTLAKDKNEIITPMKKIKFNFNTIEEEVDSHYDEDNFNKSIQPPSISRTISNTSSQINNSQSNKKDPFEFKLDKKKRKANALEDNKEFPPETIRDMRTKNLKEKSFSALLLDILFKRYDSPEIINLALEFKIDLKKLKSCSNLNLPSNMLNKKSKNDDNNLSLCIGTEVNFY